MKKTILIILLLLSSLVGLFNYVEASEGAEFYVELDKPQNQINKEAQYFDVNNLLGENQTLTLYIKNESSVISEYSITLTDAATNSSGVIAYNNTDGTKQVLPTHRFTDIASSEKLINIKKGETKAIKINMKYPSAKFDGVILGGIHISPKLSELQKQNSGFTNLFTRSVAVQIQGNEIKDKYNFHLKNMEIDRDSKNFTINNLLVNQAPLLLKNTELKATIVNTKNNKVIFEEDKKVDIAPSADFNFPILLDKKLASGKYELVLNFTSTDENKKQQEIRQSFTIDGEQLILANHNWYWLLILVIALLLFVIIYLVYGRKKKNEKNQ